MLAKRLLVILFFSALILGAFSNSGTTDTHSSEAATQDTAHTETNGTASEATTTVEWPTDSMEPPNGVCPGQGKVIAEVIGLIILAGTSIYLGISNSQYKGHSGREVNFCGHEEQTMLSFFVNLFASVSYFARVVANGSCQSGFVIFTSIRYFDYLLACPLLILDLLWNLESPYKWTCSGLVLVSIVHGVAAFTSPAPGSFAWFAGGCFVFMFAYTSIIYLVLERLKHFSISAASDSQNQAAIGFLKVSASCFFFVWIWYPLVYLLSPKILNFLTGEQQDIIHMVLDVLAKSVYGFVSLSFRYRFDKSFLRGITEEEYVEFSKRSPQRRSIRMQIRLGETEAKDGSPQGFSVHVQNEDTDRFREPALGGGNLGAGGMGVTRQAVKSGLFQPYDPTTQSPPISEDGHAPSRLLFPLGAAGPPMDGRQTVVFGGREFGHDHSLVALPSPASTPLCCPSPCELQTSELPMDEEAEDEQLSWLVPLSNHLRKVGLTRAGGVERAVALLRGAGIVEAQLRSPACEEYLRAAGLSLGARRSVVSYYHGDAEPQAGEICVA